MRTGEKQLRQFLVYSESRGSVFCIPCFLLNGTSQFAKRSEGFNDWKNGQSRLTAHENSVEHRKCVLYLRARGQIAGRIDNELASQLETEIKYWRDLLNRVVALVKKFSIRGIPFRGHNYGFGSTHRKFRDGSGANRGI